MVGGLEKNFLETEKIGKLLFQLSIPATIAMLVSMLYNIIDAIFIGKFVGIEAFGGLVIAFPLQMIIISFGLMIGTGAASIVARNLGARNLDYSHRVVGSSILITLFVSMLTIIFSLLFVESILIVFGATNSLLSYGKEYFIWVIWGTPFITMAMVGQNILQAEGKARIAMNGMIVGAITNVVLDSILIVGLNLGIRGAAIATVIAQIVWFLYLALYFLRGKSILKLEKKYFQLSLEILKEIFILGIPTFIRQSSASLVMIMINLSLAHYGGEVYIVAMGVIQRIIRVFMVPIGGIVQGFKPIAGFNYGAGRADRVRKVLYYAVISSTITCIIAFILMIVFPKQLFQAMTSDQELIAMGMPILRIVVIIIPIIGIQLVGSEFFLALGKGLPAFILGLSRQVILLIPLIVILPMIFGLNGIFIAFPIADLIATIITIIFILKEIKNLDNDKQF